MSPQNSRGQFVLRALSEYLAIKQRPFSNRWSVRYNSSREARLFAKRSQSQPSRLPWNLKFLQGLTFRKEENLKNRRTSGWSKYTKPTAASKATSFLKNQDFKGPYSPQSMFLLRYRQRIIVRQKWTTVHGSVRVSNLWSKVTRF